MFDIDYFEECLRADGVSDQLNSKSGLLCDLALTIALEGVERLTNSDRCWVVRLLAQAGFVGEDVCGSVNYFRSFTCGADSNYVTEALVAEYVGLTD